MKYIPVEVAIQMVMHALSQYGNGNNSGFDHKNMSVGEDITDFIESQGYGEDQGYSCEYNEKGKALEDGDLPDDISALVIEV